MYCNEANSFKTLCTKWEILQDTEIIYTPGMKEIP